jgi:hypothetical protein
MLEYQGNGFYTLDARKPHGVVFTVGMHTLFGFWYDHVKWTSALSSNGVGGLPVIQGLNRDWTSSGPKSYKVPDLQEVQ